MADLIIPDANIFLDVVRGRAVGAGKNPPSASSAEDASRMSELISGGEVRVGLHPLVEIEYERSLEGAVAAARQGYNNMVKRLVRLRLPELPPDALKAEQLLDNDKLIAERLLAQAEHLDESDEDRDRAEARYAQRQPPAHAGDSKTHDSRILEGALRIACTRDPGTTWLITRNTTEFEKDGQLHPDLEGDYEEAGLVHARSLREYLGKSQHLP